MTLQPSDIFAPDLTVPGGTTGSLFTFDLQADSGASGTGVLDIQLSSSVDGQGGLEYATQLFSFDLGGIVPLSPEPTNEPTDSTDGLVTIVGNPIPEPASLGLLVAGGAVAYVAHRRLRRRNAGSDVAAPEPEGGLEEA